VEQSVVLDYNEKWKSNYKGDIMKKSLIIMLLLAAFLATGCSSKNSVQNNTSKNSAQNTTTSGTQNTTNSSTAQTGTSTSASTEKSTKPTTGLTYTVHGVPVLMYHSIGVEEGNPIKMPAEQFDAEMKYIKDQGYTTLTMDELYNYFENSVPIPDKSVVITLDDGYVDNYTGAFPILKKYGLKATIFMITSAVDTNPGFLTSAQLQEMEKYGIEIESHTVTHPDLDTLSYSKQLSELTESKAALEKILGRTVEYVAYPTGKYNDDTLKAVKAAGYKMAFTTNGRWSDKSDGILTLDRVYVSTFHSMSVFNTRLTNPNYPIN
jgi:peptidoglycan/xylan/chitin deacetylase (PgdA/CDA1 family)